VSQLLTNSHKLKHEGTGNSLLVLYIFDVSENSSTISIGGNSIANLWFADDVDGLAGSEEEFVRLVTNLDQSASRYGMEISNEKTKLMTNSAKFITPRRAEGGKKHETVQEFKYLAALINEEGSKAERLATAAQASAALRKLKPIRRDENITLQTKVKLLYALI